MQLFVMQIYSLKVRLDYILPSYKSDFEQQTSGITTLGEFH